MNTIETCGNKSVRVEFNYTGNISDGVTLKFESADFRISSENIAIVIEHFKGQYVVGGFSMTNPPAEGVGAFLLTLGCGLTPRHASFLCAILQHEGYATCSLNGNAVMVSFKN